MRYCSKCGSDQIEFKVPADDNLKRYICSACGSIFYTNPNLIVGTICIKDEHVLLCKRNIEPRFGRWTLPAGFMENAETLQEGALRETKEETGIVVKRDQIIGQLKPVTTLNSGFTILPFVCILDKINDLRANSEVEKFLEIPLMQLLQTLSDDQNTEHNSIQEMYTFTFQDYVIWGASARMLKQITDKLEINE